MDTSKKLATETKIRNATQNLARLKSPSLSSIPSPSTRILHQSTSALETSERKVDVAQTQLGRAQEHAANVTWQLLEHRAVVLVTALAENRQAGKKDELLISAQYPLSLGHWGTSSMAYICLRATNAPGTRSQRPYLSQ